MRQTKIRGLYKQKIKSMFYKSDNLLNLLIGDCSELSNTEKFKKFNENVKTHLFIDDTLTEKETLIFFDMVVRRDGKEVELKDVTFKTEKDGKYTFITYDFVILGEETNFLNIVENSFKRSASIARLVWLSFLI